MTSSESSGFYGLAARCQSWKWSNVEEAGVYLPPLVANLASNIVVSNTFACKSLFETGFELDYDLKHVLVNLSVDVMLCWLVTLSAVSFVTSPTSLLLPLPSPKDITLFNRDSETQRQTCHKQMQKKAF